MPPADPPESSGPTAQRSRRLWWVLLAVGAVVAIVAVRAGKPAADSSHAGSPQQTAARYGGSDSCRECHAEEYQLWAGSHHRLAQRGTEPRYEDAAFAPARSVPIGSRRESVFKTGPDYNVEATGLAGTQECFRVQGVIGESPLRQFLVAFPGGRLQALQAAYDPRSNQWFNVFGREDRNPGEWGHWTGRGMNWNSMCAGCHNTRLQKNYDEPNDRYRTTMAEAAVGCEACHGPLQAHSQWQKQFARTGRPDPTLPRWPKERTLDNCGFCHARRSELTGEFAPGDQFLDRMHPAIVDATDTFYPDGQVHEEDYEYAAFLGSRMHAQGVRCVDCHNPHSGRLLLPGNWLCLRCHNGSYPKAPVVDPVSHSHHRVFGYDAQGRLGNLDLSLYQAGAIRETGGECVNCHMPQTVYMQRHARRDHGFTIPDPLLTQQAGVPNACNRCHQDKDARWALQYCQEWYGAKMDRPSRRRALVIAAARRNEPQARGGLAGLLATNDVPYWRAVAAGLLAPWAENPEIRQALLKGLKDGDGLVRLECIQALEPLANHTEEVAGALRECLQDPLRAVRVAAAWATRANLDASSAAAKGLLQWLAHNSDQPAGQMQLAAFALARGQATSAVAHYRRAADWDPNAAIIRHDYAVALAGLGRAGEAAEQLRAASRLEPTNADFQFKLALALNELGQTDGAIAALRTAVQLDPGHARAWYNLGLALNAAGSAAEGLQALERAEAADRSDPRSPYAQATILARLGAAGRARQAALRALTADPNFAPARDLLRSLE